MNPSKFAKTSETIGQNQLYSIPSDVWYRIFLYTVYFEEPNTTFTELCVVSKFFLAVITTNTTEISIKKAVEIDYSSLANFLEEFKNLTDLDFTEVPITDGDIKSLSILVNLKEVSFKSCKGIVGDGILHLSTLTNLKRINFNDSSISAEGISYLSTLTSLTGLNIKLCYVKDAGLLSLQVLTSLIKLNISYGEITESGISHLSTLLTNLTSLNISRCYHVKDTGLSYISTLLTNLQELSASGMDIKDEGISHLSNLSNLTKLNVSDCAFIKGEKFSLLTNLTSLNVYGCYIIQENVSYISTLTNLTDLNIGSITVKREDIAHLSTLTNLKKLDIWGNFDLKPEDDKYILSTFSNLKELRR